MKAAVIDACVAIKWVVDEEHRDAALHVLEHVQSLHMPAHWLAEAGTALWAKACIHRHITESEMHERLGYLAGLPVVTAPLAGLTATAGALSLQLRVPLYDTLYLCLAEKLAMPLVTVDRRLVRLAETNARFAGLLVWIGDIPIS